MTTSADDISVVLSGGSTNLNPNNSLGGSPSSNPVLSASLNNLFDDISPEEASGGIVDYRCIYFFNDGDTTVWDVKLWIEYDDPDGASMEIGIEERNELQRITINGNINDGALTLQYDNKTFMTYYNPDLATWATQLQDTLSNLIDDVTQQNIFKNVVVTAQAASSEITIFDIRWSGKDGKRNLLKFEVAPDGNMLLPSGATVIITVPQEGSPINTIAPQINVENTPPGGVVFYQSDYTSPISLPCLYPNDGFPLWVKRVVNANTSSKENDNFILKFSAQSLET